MQRETVFYIKSSSGGSYEVSTSVEGSNSKIKCSCKAAKNFTLCKHVSAILENDVSMLFDPSQSKELAVLHSSLAEIGLVQIYQQMAAEISNIEAAQKRELAPINKEAKRIKSLYSEQRKNAKQGFMILIS